VSDGRTVGFADYGTPRQTAVVWCHGGPGNRFEPSFVADAAGRAGMRLVAIDRPGYGRSTPLPGRTIGGWVSDAIAVVDHLGIDRFIAVGVSTGGAYALALASKTSRTIGVVACCAVSDMRWKEGKAMNVSCHPVWNAKNRDEALAISLELFGEHGEMILPPLGPAGADPSDASLIASPRFRSYWSAVVPEMFTYGVIGITDDRLADGGGWNSFDVATIRCPVTVLHGSTDGLMPVENARYTAAVVPGAKLRIIDNLGHLSILDEVVEVTSELLEKPAVIG
jgi:pimeloyl-ACP methyl ester carboxylesterase